MNKKERKVTTRHDRHVLHGVLKTAMDTQKSPEETEDILNEKKAKCREAKRS